MVTRLVKLKPVGEDGFQTNQEWHWRYGLQVFSETGGTFCWGGHNFVVEPWQVTTLPICYGVRKKLKKPKIVVELKGTIINRKFESTQAARQFVLGEIK